LACARPDAAADAADLRPQLAGGAEISAGQAPDVPARGASPHLSEPRAAPAAEPPAEEPYTPVVARFAEQSCVAPEVAEQPDAPQWEPLAAPSPKSPEAFPQMKLGLLEAASPGVPEAR
jgi:hypothetical protein